MISVLIKPSIQTVKVYYPPNNEYERYARSIGLISIYTLMCISRKYRLYYNRDLNIFVNLKLNDKKYHSDYYAFALPVLSEIHIGLPEIKKLKEDVKKENLENHVSHVYAVVHEIIHVIFPFRDTKKGEVWAIFLGKSITEILYSRFGRNLWPDAYDYRSTDVGLVNTLLNNNFELRSAMRSFEEVTRSRKRLKSFVKKNLESYYANRIVFPDETKFLNKRKYKLIIIRRFLL